ncbi:MAG: hypothetical protein WKF30_14915 [Pyrinomonadaceae bacterium]
MVALAINFAPSVEGAATLDLLTGLNSADRQAAELRWRRCLSSASSLNDARRGIAIKGSQLEMSAHFRRAAHVLHASHISAALRQEPPRVRRLLLPELPPLIAEVVAAERGLGINPTDLQLTGDINERIAALVRQSFLARFVFAEMLPAATALDLLTGTELVRFIRLLGVRETALACRGIAQLEAIASFLRLFPPVDARAIAAHMRALTEVSLERVRLAERVVRSELEKASQPVKMLDRVGLTLIAQALARRDATTVKFTMQKIHIPGAKQLKQLILSSQPDGPKRALADQVVLEIEALAVRLRQAWGSRTHASIVNRMDEIA